MAQEVRYIVKARKDKKACKVVKVTLKPKKSDPTKMKKVLSSGKTVSSKTPSFSSKTKAKKSCVSLKK